MKKITLVAVDDHQLITEMYTRLFLNHESIEMVGESHTLAEALVLIKVKVPDIVLLDISMGKESGLDVVPLIHKISPATRIIAVSMFCHFSHAKKAFQSGVKAYVTKNSASLELFNAIEQVMNGKVYVCSQIQEALSEQMFFKEIEPGLTFRELDIINLVKEGLTSREIGIRRKISLKTVEVHRYNILKKLRIKNTASLINYINTTDLTFSGKRIRQVLSV